MLTLIAPAPTWFFVFMPILSKLSYTCEHMTDKLPTMICQRLAKVGSTVTTVTIFLCKRTEYVAGSIRIRSFDNEWQTNT